MEVPGNLTQLSKNDGVVSYSTIIAISESPVMPGVVWAGTDDGNLQVSRDGGDDVHGGRQEPAGAAGEPPVLDLAHRRVALRPGHGIRLGRRPPQRRPEAVRLRDARLRQDVPEHQPATCRRPATCRSIREDPKNKDLLYVGTEFGLFVSLDGGQELAEVHEQLPDGADRRHPDPSARQRSDRRDARAQRVHRRRHHAAAAAHAGGARAPTRRCSTSVRRSRG